MKYMIVSLLLLLLGVMPVGSQILPGVESVDRLWQKNETRIYRFIADTVHDIGTLEVTMTSHDGDQFSFRHKLFLELSKVERGVDLSNEGKITVYARGLFHSGDMEIKLGDRQAEIEATYDEANLKISGNEDSGDSREFEIPVDGRVFLYESYLPYQLELALAAYDFVPGEDIIFPSVSLQNKFATEYEVAVSGKFGAAGAHNIDSVWALAMLRPEQLLLYFDESKRLIKIVDEENNLEINLVSVKYAPSSQATKSSSLTPFRDRMPIYGIYIAAVGLGLLVMGKKGYSDKTAYLMLLIGATLYPLIYLLHDPMQLYYGRAVLQGAGEGMAWWAIPPALLTGLIYQGLKILPLLIFMRVKRQKAESLIYLGAFIGAGFGLVNAFASELSGTKFLTILYMLNNISMVLFHILTGALIGYGLARSKVMFCFAVAVALHASTVYLSVFVDPSLSAAQTFMAIRQMVIITGLYHLALFIGMFFLKQLFLNTLGPAKGKR